MKFGNGLEFLHEVRKFAFLPELLVAGLEDSVLVECTNPVELRLEEAGERVEFRPPRFREHRFHKQKEKPGGM